MTDPDPNILKSAAAYLVQVARTTKGGRYRKSAKIEALRECKDEILEAHRIAQIFRERNVDISTQHLMRAIRLFIKEGEGTKAKDSVAQGTGSVEKASPGPVTYQVSDPPSAGVREEEFAKQLRLARYLARASLGPGRTMEKVGERGRSVAKPRSKTKTQPQRQKGEERELARERRRAQQFGQNKTSSGRGRSEKQRSGPTR